MKKIKGIIFDFNGVLWWDSHLHEQVWKEFSKEVRDTELSNEEIQEHVHGRKNRDILEYLMGRKISEAELHELTRRKETMYRELCLSLGSEFKLAPGAIEFLNFLKEKNIPRTIATASEIVNLKFFFEHLDLDNWFSFDLTAYDDGIIRGKPAPDLYIRATEKLSLSPSDCLVIEDSRSGIASAYAAGIAEIAALGPKEKQYTLSQLEGVTLTITDFNDLFEIVKNLFD